jgi:hypothetical protein
LNDNEVKIFLIRSLHKGVLVIFGLRDFSQYTARCKRLSYVRLK